jgi:aminoglycoside phosphotransferase (APT) family kinase protein
MCAGDRAVEIWHRLRAVDPRQETPEAFPTFEPVSFIPDLNMVVQIFPYDRHLPALSRLIARPLHDLEPVFRQFRGGSWHVEKCTVEPVQYRAGRAAVLRYEVSGRSDLITTTEKRRFYAKVYRNEEQAQRTYRRLQALWNKNNAGTPAFAVAKPIAYLRTLRTHVQEEVTGITLRQVLLNGGNMSWAVQRTARALATFGLDEVAGLPHHGLADEVGALRTASEILGWALPNLRGQVEFIVDIVAAGLSDAPPGPTHRELRTDHIFLDGEQIAVVDLDSLTRADPVLDFARVLADFAGLRFRFDRCDDGRWKAAAHTFHEEYFRVVPRVWRDRLRYHYAGALLREAVDSFRHLEPRWQQKVTILINEAENALSGGGSASALA